MDIHWSKYFMQKIFAGVLVVLLLLACGNKSRDKEPIFNDSLPAVEEVETDTVVVTVPEKAPKLDEKHATSVSSSAPRSRKSSSDDNMRGFDPASEDDMDDNGMSRYMENNDEEGWD